MKIHVKVKPSSSKEEVKKVNDAEYIVNLKEPARDNKANLGLIKILKKYFKQEVKIISGFKSKNKMVEFEK